jgi:hypothetical protein
MKTLLTQLSITAALLSIVAPAYSASISFSPNGQQLDSDPINDLGVSVGEQFTFTLSIDTTGLTSNLKSFTYVVTRDNNEILLDTADLTAEASMLFTRTPISDINTPPFTVGTVKFDIKPGQTFTPGSQLNFGTATYTVQSGLVNDGQFDYKLELIEALDEQDNDITDQFQIVSQELEVQPVPESSSTLGLLALGTLSAALTLKHKLKPSK